MAIGTRLNQYEVIGRIGAGGMGEVYRARDTRLGRDVALKVLHRRFSDDPASRERLRREARLVAQLAHPNIGAIHGLEEVDGTVFLVLEIVDGASLAKVLEDGPIPVREALEIAAQIAAAVSEAHGHGILHRDLKPSNIMVDERGRARVLDFGLATCDDPEGRCFERIAAASTGVVGAGAAIASTAPLASPPVSADAPTAEIDAAALDLPALEVAGKAGLAPREQAAVVSGTAAAPADAATHPPEAAVVRGARSVAASATDISVAGTPVYMSPEQVRGEPLDRHSDVWAVGCILFEMLTGKRPFQASSIAATFDQIIEREPEWEDVPEDVPESVRVLLYQMLDKNPRRRIGDLKDAQLLLESALLLMTGGLAAPGARRRRRTSIGVGAALVGIASVVLGAALSGSSLSGDPTPGFDSIAVLPIANLTGDPARETAAAGMTEELTTELGRVEALKVVSRSSVNALDGRGVALPELARRLGVRALVEASLLEGEQVRLSVRLYDAVEDAQLWAEIYEEDAADIELLQAQVTQAVVARLGVELSAEEKAHLDATRAVDPEASMAYLDGRYWAAAGRNVSAIESFRRAVEIDPGYAAAWAGLANAYVYRLPSNENMPRARHAAQTALNLDETLGEAHAALAQVRFFFDWYWDGAEASFLRALALAPNSAAIRQRYAGLLWAQGRIEEAREQLSRAEQLDPMSLFVKLELARTDYFARDYDASIEAYRALLDRDRDFWWAHMFLGISLQQSGRLAESANELIKAHTMLSEELGAALSTGFDDSGYDGLMRAWIREGEDNPRVQPTSLAAQNAFIGNIDEAIRRLELAFEQRTRALVWIAVDPQYDPLRSDPRFRNLLQRMGLES